MRNIYEEYGEYCPKDSGRLPVLLFENLTFNQKRALLKNRSACVDFSKLERVEIPRVYHKKSGYDQELYNLIIFAKDEQEAMSVFMKKVGLLKRYNQELISGSTFDLCCVNADGEIRHSNYVPMLKVYCKTDAALAEVEEIANKFLARRNRGTARGRLGPNGVAELFVELHDIKVSSKEIKEMRVLMLNTVYNTITKKYRAIKLDDRGGMNTDNIDKYISRSTKLAMQKNANDVTQGEDESERSAKSLEQRTGAVSAVSEEEDKVKVVVCSAEIAGKIEDNAAERACESEDQTAESAQVME